MLLSSNHLVCQVVDSFLAMDVTDIVISPGSRNAPLIYNFSNIDSFKCYSIVDERSAGFFALGMALNTNRPVVLLCSSGSALLNYYPSIAEAFYSNLSLIVLSADRPSHKIDIGDGQTIRQENVFQNHILESLSLSKYSETNDKKVKNILRHSILGKGPIHVNIPIEEPLYEYVERKKFKVSDKVKILRSVSQVISHSDLDFFIEKWNASSKKMILVGQQTSVSFLEDVFGYFLSDPSLIVLTETTSNFYHSEFINSIDRVLVTIEDKNNIEDYTPEILLTFGGMVVSKKIKSFLRKQKPKYHFHIDSKTAYDTYFSLTHHFQTDVLNFNTLVKNKINSQKSTYNTLWQDVNNSNLKKHNRFLKKIYFTDLFVFNYIFSKIPRGINLHIANSSPIRYHQLFDVSSSQNKVYSNRGTSGIEGSVSTAVGFAHLAQQSTILITGDISFFYDSNALWNNYIKNDFKIILINNEGGGIFKILNDIKEEWFETYLETTHTLSAKHLCEMHRIQYWCSDNMHSLKEKFREMMKNEKGPCLLEIKTPRLLNDKVLKSYFETLKKE